jgi:hypothetical protein
MLQYGVLLHLRKIDMAGFVDVIVTLVKTNGLTKVMGVFEK